jgi:hypothetical protein
MLHNFVSLVVVASIFLVSIVASNHVSAQPINSLQQNINAIYAVSIVPGAAEKNILIITIHHYCCTQGQLLVGSTAIMDSRIL